MVSRSRKQTGRMNEIQGMLHISSSAGVVGGWRMGEWCDHCLWGMVVDG